MDAKTLLMNAFDENSDGKIDIAEVSLLHESSIEIKFYFLLHHKLVLVINWNTIPLFKSNLYTCRLSLKGNYIVV